jgi:hypothetical protein
VYALPSDCSTAYHGLTKKEWFAGQALAGIASRMLHGMIPPDEVAVHCFAVAEAMVRLSERQ